MKGGRFSEEQILGVLREHETGAKPEEVCRRHGIASATFCKWIAKYGSSRSRRRAACRGRQRLREAVAERRRCGYRRLGWLLAREGHAMNHKKLYQLYHEEKRELERLAIERAAPRAVVSDNGTELTSGTNASTSICSSPWRKRG